MAVADPDFPEWAQTSKWVLPAYYFAKLFAENCMKMK